VARDRKRARQRRARRPVREGASAPAQHRPVRADLPGALDHTGDVDEFDAALIRGAGGVPVEPVEDRELVEESEAGAEQEPATSGAGGRGNGGAGAIVQRGGEASFGGEAAAGARRPSQSIGARVVAFLRASWAELQRVQWPDRREVTQATAVVLGFVAVMGAYLGVADWVAQKIVNLIL
jgi:preprotein translocase subunit SecE